MAEGVLDNNSSTSANPVLNTAASSVTTENISKIIISPQTQLIQTQLDETNYLLWKFQIQTAVRGYELEDYILGTKEVPQQFIINNEGNSTLNREYTIYQRQDSLLSSWILSTISANLSP